MATRSRYIDPETGDYILANGAPTEDTTVASEVVLAIRSRRGSAGATPEFGSRLHTIKKLVPGADRLAMAYAREAIQHLIDRGEVVSPSFKVELDEAHQALLVTVTYTNRAQRAETVPVTVPIT
jgi:phage gp46-like protein